MKKYISPEIVIEYLSNCDLLKMSDRKPLDKGEWDEI